jgi:hypothetical protein
MGTHVSSTSVLAGGECLAPRPDRFIPGKEPTVLNGQETRCYPTTCLRQYGEMKILDPTGTRTPNPRSSSP